MKKLPSLLSVFILMIALCSSALGQTYQNPLDKTVGPFLNIHGIANQFNSTNGPNAFGGGLGLKLGASAKRFNIYLDVDASVLGSGYGGATYTELGGQFNFATTNPDLIPYAETGFSLQFTGFENETIDVSLFGAGFFLGGGIKYFISPKIAFVTGLKFLYADVMETDSSSNISDSDLFSTRLTAGFSWYPFN